MRGGTTSRSTLASRRNICADCEMSSGTPHVGDKRAAARSRGNTSDSSASSDEDSGRRKRGGHGARGAVDVPAFMQLSGEASESGRRSRSGSRDGSRGPSPVRGVEQAAPAAGPSAVAAAGPQQQVGVQAIYDMVADIAHSAPAQPAASLEVYGHRCFWCLTFDPDHPPASCSHRQKPDMSDFASRRPAKTRRVKKRNRPKAQTVRSPAEQKQHETDRKIAWAARNAALESAAKARAITFAASISQPIAGALTCATRVSSRVIDSSGYCVIL